MVFGIFIYSTHTRTLAQHKAIQIWWLSVAVAIFIKNISSFFLSSLWFLHSLVRSFVHSFPLISWLIWCVHASNEYSSRFWQNMKHDTQYACCWLRIEICFPSSSLLLLFSALVFVRSLLSPLDWVWCARLGGFLYCTHRIDVRRLINFMSSWVGWLLPVFSRSLHARCTHTHEWVFNVRAQTLRAHITNSNRIRDTHINVVSMHSFVSLVRSFFILVGICFRSNWRTSISWSPALQPRSYFGSVWYARLNESMDRVRACSFFSLFSSVRFVLCPCTQSDASICMGRIEWKYAKEAHSIHCLCSTHSLLYMPELNCFFHIFEFSIPSMSNDDDGGGGDVIASLSFFVCFSLYIILNKNSVETSVYRSESLLLLDEKRNGVPCCRWLCICILNAQQAPNVAVIDGIVYNVHMKWMRANRQIVLNIINMYINSSGNSK